MEVWRTRTAQIPRSSFTPERALQALCGNVRKSHPPVSRATGEARAQDEELPRIPPALWTDHCRPLDSVAPWAIAGPIGPPDNRLASMASALELYGETS